MVGAGLGGVTERHMWCVLSHAGNCGQASDQASRWARPVPALAGQVMSRARRSGHILNESQPDTKTEPGGDPPRTAAATLTGLAR